ncbi:MAG: BtpA/SgcQ family protein [Nanoarchaeota archaeon]|nr:BtpA/SgcQ family protein [Nanoarchaeota archaeon]
MDYETVFNGKKNIIGMVHLLPLSSDVDFVSTRDITDRALYDAEALVKGGIRHAIIENDGDRPFGISNEGYDFSRIRERMIEVGRKINSELGTDLTLGVQVLNNYGDTPGIVEAIGGKFLRSQFYWEHRIDSDGREIHPNYNGITAANFGLDFVILADIDSKGSTPAKGNYDREDSIARLVKLAKAEYKPDALIVTGSSTGNAPDAKDVSDFAVEVQDNDPNMPIGVGSGVTPEAIQAGLLDHVSVAVVGSFFKTDGKVDMKKVEQFMLVLGDKYAL